MGTKQLVKIIIISLVLLSGLNAHVVKQGPAVCVVPVADLVGSPIAYDSYATLPLVHASGSFASCPRIHQLLFNEVITIKEVRNNQVCIEMPSLFYESVHNQYPQIYYWALQDQFVNLSTLEQQNIPLHALPQPLINNRHEFAIALHGTIALIQPFYDKTTKKTYSAGTRFVQSKVRTDQHYFVYAYNAQKGTLEEISLPKSHALAYEQKSPEERIADFVRIVQSWAHQTKGFIPYVWGGTSFVTTVNAQECAHMDPCARRTSIAALTGLDCSGLVTLGSRLAGIPFFYKNSITQARHLSPLKRGQAIEPGDLIWIAGHVIVVSDVHRGLMVEARHYNHGYGYIHEIPLSQEFKDIKTYDDLAQAFFSRRPLTRLRKDGSQVQLIPEFKILKMASVWHSK